MQLWNHARNIPVFPRQATAQAEVDVPEPLLVAEPLQGYVGDSGEVVVAVCQNGQGHHVCLQARKPL